MTNRSRSWLSPFIAGALVVGGAGVAALAGPAPAANGATATSSTSSYTWRYSLNRVLRDGRIRESSGLARSTYDRRVVFTHNDSGDSARFFAVGRRGRTLATFTLLGATHRDWEDISPGPRHTIWLGDIGDNSRSRGFISVYRVREPRRTASRALRYKRYDLVYPDGAHNAETLMVDPRSGRVLIVTKDAAGGHVYRAPRSLSTRGYNRLRMVAAGPVLATGGDFFPGGRRYVVRTHNRAYVYRHLGARPTMVKLPTERQGESIDVTRSGRYLLTGSEGLHSPVHRVDLRGIS